MMTIVSQSNLGCGFAVSSATRAMCDWGEQDSLLTFMWCFQRRLEKRSKWSTSEETTWNMIELRQTERWFLMTILYLSVRFIGIVYAVYANKSYLTMSISKLGYVSSHCRIQCIFSFDRWHRGQSQWQIFNTNVSKAEQLIPSEQSVRRSILLCEAFMKYILQAYNETENNASWVIQSYFMQSLAFMMFL